MPVSVIMPALNAERFIEAAIRSLLRESDDLDLDIIVIDDGSTDGTRSIVGTLSDRYSQVRLLQNPGKGIASARNTGIAALPKSCRFVAFLDSDDLSVSGRLVRQRSVLLDDPTIDALYGRIEMFQSWDNQTMEPAPDDNTKIIRGPYLQSAMFRPQIFETIGLFDEKYRQGDDTDFALRIIEHECHMVLDDAIAAYYRRHDTNVTLNTEEMKREFMLASLKWAARRRHGGQVIPDVFSKMFLRRDEIEEGYGQ